MWVSDYSKVYCSFVTLVTYREQKVVYDRHGSGRTCHIDSKV